MRNPNHGSIATTTPPGLSASVFGILFYFLPATGFVSLCYEFIHATIIHIKYSRRSHRRPLWNNPVRSFEKPYPMSMMTAPVKAPYPIILKAPIPLKNQPFGFAMAVCVTVQYLIMVQSLWRQTKSFEPQQCRGAIGTQTDHLLLPGHLLPGQPHNNKWYSPPDIAVIFVIRDRAFTVRLPDLYQTAVFGLFRLQNLDRRSILLFGNS